MAYDWPNLDNDYDIAAHALGRIVIIWNKIESVYDSFVSYCSHSFENRMFMGSILNNSQKISLIKYTFEVEPNRYGNLPEDVLRFLKYAQICGGNRNFFIHAFFIADKDTAFFFKKAQDKIATTNMLTQEPDDLRQVANDMAEVLEYGNSLSKLFVKHVTQMDTSLQVKLPKAPSQPKSWDTHPSKKVHRTRKPQHQS